VDAKNFKLIILNRREVSQEDVEAIGHAHRIQVPGKESESVAIIWAPSPFDDQAIAPELNGVWLFGKGKRELNYDRDPNIEPICFTSLFPRGTQGFALKRYRFNPTPAKKFMQDTLDYEEMDMRVGGGPPNEHEDKMELQDEWSSGSGSDAVVDEEFLEELNLEDMGIFQIICFNSFILFLLQTRTRWIRLHPRQKMMIREWTIQTSLKSRTLTNFLTLSGGAKTVEKMRERTKKTRTMKEMRGMSTLWLSLETKTISAGNRSTYPSGSSLATRCTIDVERNGIGFGTAEV
jgi:hypothetical protein